MTPVQIFGRSSSHYTRLTRIFAEECGVPYELIPIHDMTARDSDAYADNPALKLPTLRTSEGVLFGAENICRALAERAGAYAEVTWPEQLSGTVSRNAQELVWHCMAAQVQLVFGTAIAKLPADNVYFEKARDGFAGGLVWLDRNIDKALDALPATRRLSMFEASLFCLVEHLHFRKTLPVDRHAALVSFATEFAKRPSAQRTAYRFDTPPA